MSEFEELYGDYFFIIDSTKLDDVKQKLYGYILNDKGSFENNDLNENIKLNHQGAYIHVNVNSEEIIISQDYHGSYGLYLFKKDDYFAISNSFIKLVEYLKKEYSLSLNKDYADALLFADLCSFAYNETMIQEIEMLPRNYNIIINKKTKSIIYDEINYQDHSVDINTKEGIEILDKWYEKWIHIIRLIRSKTNNISFDLSGGFDTRLLASLWLTANINLDNITIFSNEELKEDLEISSKIANDFNFKLNKVFYTSKRYFNNLETVINSSFYVKLGFHKQMYFKNFTYNETYNRFTGHGGENLRGFPHQTISEYNNRIIKYVENHSHSLIKPSIKLSNKGLKKLSEKQNMSFDNEYALTSAMYKEGRNRHHFGKEIVEYYLSNTVTFAPLMDLELYKLKINTSECDDNQLLLTLILDRYCPKLLEYKIQGARGFKKETLIYVKKINEKYPYSKREYSFIKGPETNVFINKSEEHVNLKNADEFLKEVFHSKSFKHEFEKYYSTKLYNDIEKIVESKHRTKFREIYSSIAIIKINKDIEFKNYENYSTIFDWLKTFETNKTTEEKYTLFEKLNKYVTARIDIKNKESSDNNIEIIRNSDVDSKVNSPDWYNDKFGKGKVIQSTKGNIHLKIKCIKNGKLEIKLKGIYFKNEGELLPIFIKYTNFEVNGKKILKKPEVHWHNNQYVYEKHVFDGDIIDIAIDWEAI